MCHQVVNKTLLLLHPPQVRDKTKVRVLTDMLQLLLVMPKVSFLQSDALCFTLNTCTFIVLWSRKSGTMMYFKFSISPSVNNHSSKLSATRTHTHAHMHMHTQHILSLPFPVLRMSNWASDILLWFTDLYETVSRLVFLRSLGHLIHITESHMNMNGVTSSIYWAIFATFYRKT